MKIKDETLGDNKIHGSFTGSTNFTDTVWGDITGDIQDQKDLIELIDTESAEVKAEIVKVAESLTSNVARLDSQINKEVSERQADIQALNSLLEVESAARLSLAQSIERDTIVHRKTFEVLEPKDITYTFDHNLQTKDLLINTYSIYGEDLNPIVKREYDSITLTFDEVPQSFRVVVFAINKWELKQLATDLPMF